jgi:midasin
MERGEWLLIDGANRCSAAVLDRLNSLMEPNGSILLSERGSIDGKILEIKPHPEFRLILTVNPTYGEISR